MWWGVLFCILIVGCAGSTGAAQAPRAPAASATPDPFCATAVDAVKAYKAPGQREPVDDLVQAGMLAERRPHSAGRWSKPRRAGDDCQVMYTATIGNTPTSYIWRYTPATGRVTTTDADTKRLIGW